MKMIFEKNVNLEQLDMSSCMFRNGHSEMFAHLSSLSVLDMSSNQLRTFNFNVSTTKLRLLDLQNNSLQSLNSAMRAQLEVIQNPVTVNLQSNPLSCGCDNLNFIHWFQTVNNKSVHFAGGMNYECSFAAQPYKLARVDVNYLKRNCNFKIQIIVAVFLTLGAVCLILLAFLTYRKRWLIRHGIFNIKEKCFPSSDAKDKSYRYDAFILYCSDDEDRIWVHRLFVQKMEEDYGFKLCIHHRDFLAGIPIVDNIVEAIQVSRKVIAVVSPNFLKSDWCSQEIHLTNYIDRNKFIIILLRDITLGACAIQPLMRFLLETRTYIEWTEDREGEKLFWKKVVRALYAK